MLKRYRQILIVIVLNVTAFYSPAQTRQAYTQIGGGSYYAKSFQGKVTNNGERFDHNKFTCAHKKLPFNTILKVTNLQKNKVTFVRVNDRGPFSQSLIIDLTRAAAKEIDIIKYGVAKVKIQVIGMADSINYALAKSFAIPADWSESDIKPNKYYNLSGDELSVHKAYGLQLVEFNNFNDAVTYANACLTTGFEEVFYKMTEDTTGRKYTFYYGAELYEKIPIEKLKTELTNKGVNCKMIRYN